MNALSPVSNTEYLLERLVGAALMIATSVFFLAGTVNPLGYFLSFLCFFVALWFLFPNKRKTGRGVADRVEQHAEEFE
jgi:hypothetical protein